MSGTRPDRVGRNDSGVRELFAEQLRMIAQARGRAHRAKAIDELAASVQSANVALPFLARLVKADRHGRRLALEIALRLSVPLPDTICHLLRPIIVSARFPLILRSNVAIQVLRSVPTESEFGERLLQVMIHGLLPSRAIDRLRYIRQRLPSHPAIERLVAELETKSAIPCPRCGILLQREGLIVHLWQKHRLLMEGNRARDPWRMIEDWLLQYAANGKKELLDRSLELGQQLDPAEGLTRVHRLLLTSGLTDEEARQNLTAQAEGRRASLCPHCYALVQQKNETLPEPMTLSRGRISSHGYTVEVSDRYVCSRLFVATPDEILHDGAEPQHELTQRGSVLLQITPIVALALFVSIFMPLKLFPPLTPVALILLLALVNYLRVRLSHESAGDQTERAIDHAWEIVVPELHRPEFVPSEGEFLARLAVTSIGHGSPEQRERLLERVCKVTRQQVVQNSAPSEELAALRCLEIDDAIRLGHDPIPILADELAASMAGELPFQYAEQLLDSWPSESRDQGQRARLRILLCARAFEYGLEPRDLNELGTVSAEFGQAYASEDLAGLSRLRWLWHGKADRVWRKNGSATTVFDLARYPALGGEFLEARPDLLLFQPMSAGNDLEAGSPILVCEEGVVYRDVIIDDPEMPIEVVPALGGYDLNIGERTLHFEEEPVLLARRLQGWTRFLFRELLPGASDFVRRRSPAKMGSLLKQKAIHCPECGNLFLALRGDVGLVAHANPVRSPDRQR